MMRSWGQWWRELTLAAAFMLGAAVNAESQCLLVACGAENPCATGVCVLGFCLLDPPPCDDGIPCTIDRCDLSGNCLHEPADSVCPDGNVCTVGSCDPVVGCVQHPRGGDCDDDDPCTAADTCTDGRCVGEPRACDDGVACTTDGCVGGECTHAPSDAVCDPPDACVAGVCDPDRGCQPLPLSGTACDDGDRCTVGDVCTAGVCSPGPPRDCSDACVVGRECAAGECVGGSPVDCDDHVDCTRDRCDPARACVHEAATDLCDDQDPCTGEVCDAVLGCLRSPLTGSACNDGDACTSGDRCEAGKCVGRPLHCPPDDAACTDERCVNGTCLRVPVHERCGSTECSLGACRPGNPNADGQGCVRLAADDGAPCTDDGLACTDDLCSDAGCLHVPIDSRCSPASACSRAMCAPEREDHDANGCAVEQSTTNPRDGEPCAEDGDPCSDDRCHQGLCRHEPIPQVTTCTSVTAPFRKALGLAALTRSLAQDTANALQLGSSTEPSIASLTGRLQSVEDDLARVGLALAGKAIGTAGPAVSAPPILLEAPAQQRARLAFVQVRRTPASVRGFLRTLGSARIRAALGRENAAPLRRRGRLLLRGTRTLKGDLRRIQRVTGKLAR
jgi:hypothetical protein